MILGPTDAFRMGMGKWLLGKPGRWVFQITHSAWAWEAGLCMRTAGTFKNAKVGNFCLKLRKIYSDISTSLRS